MEVPMLIRRWLAVVGLCLTVSMVACVPRAATPTPVTPEPTAAPVLSPEAIALQGAQRWLEGYLGRPLSDLEVAYGTEEWPDAGLGCPEPGVEYAQVVTPGFRFDIVVDGVVYELHTNLDAGNVILCPSEGTGARPGRPEAMAMEGARGLLAAVLNQDVSELPQALTQEGAAWSDTAMGCPLEGQPAESKEIEGFRFQFLHGDQLYDVRASGDGGSTVLCTALGPITHGGAGRSAGQPLEVPAEVQAPLAAARELLAGTLGISAEELALESVWWQRATFPSSALGCPAPGIAYTEAQVEGYAFSLTSGGTVYELHTDLGGGSSILCEGATPESAAAALEWFDSARLGLSMRYPLDWWVSAREDAGEVTFRPGNNLPTLGMTIARLDGVSGVPDDWLAAFQAELFASEPSAYQADAVQVVGASARSGRFRHQLGGGEVVERVTYYAEGYQVRQWAPADQWAEWEEPFVRILGSLTFLAAQ
jgi:hypothetical protein